MLQRTPRTLKPSLSVLVFMLGIYMLILRRRGEKA